MSGADPSRLDRFPAAEGERKRWSELDPKIRVQLERHLGARVLEERSEPGGFSPGVASRIQLSDGRRMFAKIVGPEPNPDSPELHRREAWVLSQLPSGLPIPRLLSTYDDGDWVGLFLELIDGHTPRLPWSGLDLSRVVSAMEALSRQLTPPPLRLLGYGEQHVGVFTGWSDLTESIPREPLLRERLDPWVPPNLPRLVELERRIDGASSGSTMLHSDLRADNILLTERDVRFADWPDACVGAPWVDLAGFLPSVAMQGGPAPWTVFDASPLAREARTEDVDSVVASLAGYFVSRSLRPPPPGLSTLRPFQAAQGREAIRWLRRRLEDR